MTIPNNTTAKLIGLAACGAAALGLSLDAALLTRTEDLLAALTAAGLLPGTTPATTTPVAEAPAAPAAQPELALGYEQPTPPPAGAHGILARAANLIGQVYDRIAATLPDTVTDGTTLAAVRTLCSLVKSHMGRWNFDPRTGIELPRPLTPLQRLIHTADYLASRKQLLPEQF